ncbi:hypothetical protein BDN72DRAFT_903673 [Pluteus cervinus]|uniref:Uncharacterized protein n=1 Tax=Pluteus cervinus TaxID=181527 RepID=A0ACD3A868_9AGAR|nr:hypothetical protein BDN72DRAFT_903673 [Pluteus cervinus]
MPPTRSPTSFAPASKQTTLPYSHITPSTQLPPEYADALKEPGPAFTWLPGAIPGAPPKTSRPPAALKSVPADIPKYKFSKAESAWLETFMFAFMEYFNTPDSEGHFPRKDVSKWHWVLTNVAPAFSTVFFKEGGPPNQSMFEQCLYKKFVNKSTYAATGGLISRPSRPKRAKEPRHITATHLFQAENSDRFNEEMGEKVCAAGGTTRNNLPVRNEIVHNAFQLLSSDEQQSYKDKAAVSNAKLDRPPTETEILENHKFLEADVQEFFDDTLGWDGHRKHGDGAWLVFGVFNDGPHVEDRRVICQASVTGGVKRAFALTPELRKQTVKLMHQYVDLHHPLPSSAAGALDKSSVAVGALDDLSAAAGALDDLSAAAGALDDPSAAAVDANPTPPEGPSVTPSPATDAAPPSPTIGIAPAPIHFDDTAHIDDEDWVDVGPMFGQVPVSSGAASSLVQEPSTQALDTRDDPMEGILPEHEHVEAGTSNSIDATPSAPSVTKRKSRALPKKLRVNGVREHLGATRIDGYRGPPMGLRSRLPTHMGWETGNGHCPSPYTPLCGGYSLDLRYHYTRQCRIYPPAHHRSQSLQPYLIINLSRSSSQPPRPSSRTYKMKATLILFVLVVVVTMWAKHAANDIEDRLWEGAIDFTRGWVGRLDMSGVRNRFRRCLVDLLWTAAITALAYAAFVSRGIKDKDRVHKKGICKDGMEDRIKTPHSASQNGLLVDHSSPLFSFLLGAPGLKN